VPRAARFAGLLFARRQRRGRAQAHAIRRRLDRRSAVAANRHRGIHRTGYKVLVESP